MKIKLNSIRIPENRQRQTINSDRIATLAVSMQSHGQLHPITVIQQKFGSEYLLVAGYRRFLAAQQLKWEEIDALEVKDLNPLELEEIELDENLQREDLTWQEEVKAKDRLLELRKKLYGEKGVDVAEHVGQDNTTFWEDARLARAMEVIPALGKARNKSQAIAKLRLVIRRESLTALAEKRAEEKGKAWTEVAEHVHLGDCLQVMKEFEDGSISLVLTDPPYGINLDVGETKKCSSHPVIYDDATYDIMDLVALAAKEAFRLLKEDAHAYFWFDIKAHSKVLKMLQDVGFTVDPIPLIWTKGGPGQANHPDSRWGSAYETCFFCRKGSRAMLKQGQSNVLAYDPVPGNRKIHPTEKPVGLLRQLIETSTVPGEVVLDMFGGSGSTGEAAIQTGRNFVLIEKDPAYHAGIVERLSKVSNRNDCLHVFVDGKTCNLCGKNKDSKSLPSKEEKFNPLAVLEEEEGE